MVSGRKIGTYTMTASPFVVGRDPASGVHIDNVGVSRRHCQFTYENGQYFVEDLGSSNGTFYRGVKIRKTPVSHGEEVNIGKYVLVFEDTGLDLLPGALGLGAGAARPGQAHAAAPMTFMMDGDMVRQQIAKAAEGAEERVEARKAAEAGSFDPDVTVEMKEAKGAGAYIGLAIRIIGLAVLGTGLLLGFLYALGVF